MDKRKKRTGKPGRVVIEVTEREDISFEEFERTMIKIVRSEPIKDKSKDKSGGKSPHS